MEGEEREDEHIIIETDNLYFIIYFVFVKKKNAFINHITYLSKYLFNLNGAIQMMGHKSLITVLTTTILVLNPLFDHRVKLSYAFDES